MKSKKQKDSQSLRLLEQMSVDGTQINRGDLTYLSPFFDLETDMHLLPLGYVPPPVNAEREAESMRRFEEEGATLFDEDT